MHISFTMLTTKLLMFALSVWSVADGRYVDADEFTTLAAEVVAMKEERLEFNSRITELEMKLGAEEAQLKAVEDRLGVTEAKLAGTEDKLRVVEGKLDDALSRIDELEQASGRWQGEEKVTSNTPPAADEDIEGQTDEESRITTETHAQREDGTGEWTADDRGKRSSKRSVPTQRVAFSAYLSASLTQLGHHHPIKWDGVQLNEGNAFDAIMGVFICPVSGVYMFQSAVMSLAHHGHIDTEIVKDGAMLVKMFADGTASNYGYDQGFNSVITSCDQGEHVWVREALGTVVYGVRYSSFSGYLLWENEQK